MRLGTYKNSTTYIEIVFAQKELTAAINQTKIPKALGPDDVAPIMLEKLGCKDMSFLATIIKTWIIPINWKTALLKPTIFSC